jgi:hypothetical protein
MSADGRLRSPLPWGEGQGEGVFALDAARSRLMDNSYPLTPTLSPGERGLPALLDSSRLTSGAHAVIRAAEASRHAAQ